MFQWDELGRATLPGSIHEVRQPSRTNLRPMLMLLSSYDYGSPIRENRALSDKYDELKRQGLFLRSSPEFYKTDWVGDTASTIPGVTVNGTGVYVTYLRNPDTGSGFYITRQTNASSL